MEDREGWCWHRRLRSHNLATAQHGLSVGAVLTFESIDVSVGPLFFKIKTVTTGCIKP